jgi:hypothetical protein
VHVDEIICQSRYHAGTPWYVDHDSNSVKPGFKVFVIAAWQVFPDTVIVNVFTRSLNSIFLTRVFCVDDLHTLSQLAVGRQVACSWASLVIFLSEGAVVLEQKRHVQVTMNGLRIWSDPLAGKLDLNVDPGFSKRRSRQKYCKCEQPPHERPKKDPEGQIMIST